MSEKELISEVPLLPRHGVYLEVLSGDGRRFAEVFKATWRRLPLSWRRAIIPYWRYKYPSHSAPWIQLGKGSAFLPPKVVAAVYSEGCRLRFRSTLFDVMPSDVAQDVIAHEIAHVMQSVDRIVCIRGDGKLGRDYVYSDGSPFGTRMDIECDADDRMGRAGFDPESCQRWFMETGRRKDLSWFR